MENIIYTIGREFGSGGKDVGQKLAEKLGVPFFDKELLSRASAESGLCEEIFHMQDEKPTSSFLYSLVTDTYSFSNYHGSAYLDMPLSQKVFLAQFDTIKKIASEGPCVIVGRCADYALHDYQNCLHVFIHGDEKCKAKRIMERFEDINTEQKAIDMMNKKDKQRQSYYNYYSSRKWGRVDSYDLSVNSSRLGIDGTVKLITQFVEDFESR